MVDKSLFRKHAPRAMHDLMAAFPLDKLDAAAIMGNAGHESNGFTILQEVRPTVAGSRGGYGWFQWTGPRRRSFEAWAKERGLSLASYEANIGFLTHELKGPESGSVAAVKRAVGLEAKVEAFEMAFERAGIKHYSGRIIWAKEALAAYDGTKPPAVKPKLVNPKPLAKSRTMGGAGASGLCGAAVTAEAVAKASDELSRADASISTGSIIGIVIGVMIVAGAAIALYARWDDAGRPLPWKGE